MSTKAFGEHVHVMDHPLVAHKLTIMRDKSTSVKDFRELVSEIGMLITYEATRDLPMTTKHIETPICEMDAPTLAGRKFVVVPILRAGLGLVDGVLRMSRRWPVRKLQSCPFCAPVLDWLTVFCAWFRRLVSATSACSATRKRLSHTSTSAKCRRISPSVIL